MAAPAFLDDDRHLLDRHLPGLDEKLASTSLATLERPGSPAIGWFRDVGAPALFVPAEYAGLGVGLREGVRVQRAIASRAPSLAVATTMHHFSVASLVGWDRLDAGLEWLLAEAVAANSMIIASGAAEDRPGTGILRPTMTARRTDGGALVTGAKKPCSLSHSMDLLFATVRVVDDPAGERCAVAVIPAESPGLTRRPFWPSDILAGAESDEVVLADVFVPQRLISDIGPIGATTDALRRSLVWFEILIAASYVGIAAALVERAVAAGRAGTGRLAAMAVALEGATYALEGVAARSAGPVDPAALLGPALIARLAAQDAIVQAGSLAAESLGSAFLTSPEVGYLHSALRCLAFHPPSRERADEAAAEHLRGSRVDVD